MDLLGLEGSTYANAREMTDKEKDEFLYRIQEQILKYAKENDGINSIKVQLSKEDLHKLRHQYLHRSNQDDDMIAMYGRYKEGKPKRDILQG